MRTPRTRIIVVITALSLLLMSGYGRSAPEAPASPVERLVAMEELLYGRPQEGTIVGRLEAIERLIFGEPGAGTLPDRLAECWSFIQGDRAGSMNLKFKLKAVQWTIYGKVSDGPIAPVLADIEKAMIGQASPGAIGNRLDVLLRLSIAAGRPDVGYALVPKGTLIKFKTTAPISSVKSRPGDLIQVEALHDVVSEGRLVIPKGSTAVLRVIDTVRPTKMGVRARVDLEISTLDGMDSSPVAIGVDQAAVAANTGVSITAGEGIRRFSLVGKAGALGGVLSQNEELELAEGTELFFSVMQTAKVLGLAMPAGR